MVEAGLWKIVAPSSKRGKLRFLEKELSPSDKKKLLQSTTPEELLDYLKSIAKEHDKSINTKALRVVDQCGGALRKFEDVVEAAFDFGGPPANLAWSFIKVSLESVKSHVEIYDKLLDALNEIGDALGSIEIYEKSFQDIPDVKACIVDFYNSILHFWERAVVFYQRKATRRVLGVLAHDYGQEFQTLQDDLRKNKKRAKELVSAHSMAETRKFQQESLQRDLQQWLDGPHPKADLETAKSLRHVGTCEWILSDPVFDKWHKSTAGSGDSHLWIYAIPGAGKTVLASFLIEHLQSEPSTVLYYFIKHDDPRKRTPLSIMKALLLQLFIAHADNPEFIVKLQMAMNSSGTGSAQDALALQQILIELIKSLPCLVIVLDALDECPQANALLDLVTGILKNCPVKIIMTGRRERNILEAPHHTPKLILEIGEQHVSRDIEAFIAYKVGQSEKLSHPLLTTAGVVHKLQRASQGMFLWVYLMLPELERLGHPSDIAETLESLPRTLTSLYARILRRFNEEKAEGEKHLCRQLLRWIVCAKRPLTVRELLEALSVLRSVQLGRKFSGRSLLWNEKDIELACESLVVIKQGTVQLAHMSTREFLSSSNPGSDYETFLVNVPETSLELAFGCTTYLTSQDVVELVQLGGSPRYRRLEPRLLTQHLPLLEYACLFWVGHANDVPISNIEALETRLENFPFSISWRIWLEICFTLETDTMSQLRISLSLFLYRIKRGQNSPNVKGTKRKTPNLKWWIEGILTLLTTCGEALESNPGEVYYIDMRHVSVKMYALLRRTDCILSEKHTTLSVPFERDTYCVPEFQRLPIGTGRNNDLALLHYDRDQDVFYTIDAEPFGVPYVFCQHRSSGRMLMPLPVSSIETEMERGSKLLKISGAAVSQDGAYLGMVFDMSCSSVSAFISIVWELHGYLQSDDFIGDIKWAKEVIFQIQYTDIFRGSLRTIAFDSEGCVVCPSGRINLRTNEVTSLPLEAAVNMSASFTEDGHAVFLVSRDTYGHLQLINLEGKLIYDRLVELSSDNLLALSPTGRYTIWHKLTDSQPFGGMLMYEDLILDRDTGVIQSLAGFHLSEGRETDPKSRRYYSFSSDESKLVSSYASWGPILGTYMLLTNFELEEIIWNERSSFAGRVAVHGMHFDDISNEVYLAIEDGLWSLLKFEDCSSPPDFPLQPKVKRKGEEFRLSSYGISLDGKLLLRCIHDQTKKTLRLHLFDIELGDCLREITQSTYSIGDSMRNDAKFSPNLELLFLQTSIICPMNDLQYGSFEPTVVPFPDQDLLDAHTQEKITWKFAFSSDSKLLAIFTNNGPEPAVHPIIDGYLWMYRFEDEHKNPRFVRLNVSNATAFRDYDDLELEFSPATHLLLITTIRNTDEEEGFQADCFILDIDIGSLKHIGTSTVVGISFQKHIGCDTGEQTYDLYQTIALSPSIMEKSESLYRHSHVLRLDRPGSWAGRLFELIQERTRILVRVSYSRPNYQSTATRVLSYVPSFMLEKEPMLLLGRNVGDEKNSENLKDYMRLVFTSAMDGQPELKWLDRTWDEFLATFPPNVVGTFHGPNPKPDSQMLVRSADLLVTFAYAGGKAGLVESGETPVNGDSCKAESQEEKDLLIETWDAYP